MTQPDDLRTIRVLGSPEGEPFFAILEHRIRRRNALTTGARAVVALVAATGLRTSGGLLEPVEARATGHSFSAIELSGEDEVLVPPGYQAVSLIIWGDPLQPGLPAFDPTAQTPELQMQRFGYNVDGLFFFPVPAGSRNSQSGVLVINHEYTNPELMFADYDAKRPTRKQVDVELAAHGLSVVAIERDDGGDWHYDVDAPYNRRLTALTEIAIAGPAAGHPWLQTSDDPSGQVVLGSLNNCSAGSTPWGTFLTAEENFHQYFANLDGIAADDPRKSVHERYGLPRGASKRLWERHYDRFDLAAEPNEPFRYGWIVEIDPYNPNSEPTKRTALGRMRHEAATTKIGYDGRVAVYLGDDERFEYVYKFVSSGRFDRTNREANIGLLDDGVLYVARFQDDGAGDWIPLVYGEGPLTPENGWTSPADVLIRTRQAADLVGATPMDRPEDIEPNPVNGRIYAVMTNNSNRSAADVHGANPRPSNRHGHIIEIAEADGDATATRFTWEIFLLCGDPAAAGDGVYAAGIDPALVSPISCPDNIAFDSRGNLWIATDGQPGTFHMNDGVYMAPTDGPERGYVRQFLSGVVGGECSSLALTPDDTTLFVCIQHPGEGSAYDAPSSSWPDHSTPPRPGVVAVTKIGAEPGVIGS